MSATLALTQSLMPCPFLLFSLLWHLLIAEISDSEQVRRERMSRMWHSKGFRGEFDIMRGAFMPNTNRRFKFGLPSTKVRIAYLYYSLA